MPSEIWLRIADELKRKKRSWSWLASRMNYSAERVGNWKTRGIPAASHADIAVALGVTVDWLIGVGSADAGREPSPMAMRIAWEFDRIQDEAAQLSAFIHIIGVIARASGAASEPPIMLPAPPPSGGQPPRT